MPFFTPPAAIRHSLIAVLLLCGQAGAAPCTAPIVNGKLYSIASVTSGLVLDIPGGSAEAGTHVQQWGHANGAHQQFYARHLHDDVWSLEGKQSGMLLDVSGSLAGDGAPVVQWPSTGALNQQWRLRQSATGAYNVVARHSGKSLTVASGASGARLYQAADGAGGSQRWFFNPADGACGTTSGANAPDGFAAQPGPDKLPTTSGGGAAAPLTVHSCSALVSALQSSAPAVVRIGAGATIDCRTAPRAQSACALACPGNQDPGKSIYRVPVGAQTCKELGSATETRYMRPRTEISIKVRSNKTLIGLNRESRIVGASLDLSGSRNVIIRNLTLEDINPGLVEAGDGITLNKSSHVWIDHVRFHLISDGHVDISDSANVTLSWNRFDGVNPAVCGSQHHYTSMVQNSRVTLHHNFWNKGAGRNPKMDGAATRVHLYNNYWLDIPYFAINAGDGAQGKVEGNYFENAARPHWNLGSGLFDAPPASNRYTGRSARDPHRSTGARVFGDLQLYRYTLDPVDAVPDQVRNGAGPR